MNIEKKHWISNGAEIVQTGDLVRLLGENGEWNEWYSADHLAGSRVDSFVQWHGMGVQFARVPEATAEQPPDLLDELRQWCESAKTPEQPPTPTPDRGNKYHRTITQTLPGDTHGLSVTVDVYDVLKAFGVTCPAAQHAVKKLLCAGLRGQKSAEQDIEEAASSCRRAIELLEFDL